MVAMASTWLPTVISVAFIGEGIWRMVASGEATNAAEKATAVFNFVNFLIFGLLGLSCVCWPFLSKWFQRKQECEEGDSSASGGRGASSSPPGPTGTTGSRLDVIVDEAGKAPAAPGAVHAPEPQAGPKRITYLTNLKTFLTFIVVAHHAAGQWYNSSAGGIGISRQPPYDIGISYGGYESPSFTIVAAFFQNCNQMYDPPPSPPPPPPPLPAWRDPLTPAVARAHTQVLYVYVFFGATSSPSPPPSPLPLPRLPGVVH